VDPTEPAVPLAAPASSAPLYANARAGGTEGAARSHFFVLITLARLGRDFM